MNKSGYNVRFNKFIDPSKKQWIQLKAFRKFNTDFPISAIISLPKSCFACLSQNDTRIRLFDMEKKQMNTIDGHKAPILWIEQLNPQQFITGSEDGTILVWEYSN